MRRRLLSGLRLIFPFSEFYQGLMQRSSLGERLVNTGNAKINAKGEKQGGKNGERIAIV